MKREIKIGEEVLDSDGAPLGAIDRLVVDESANRVTHIVAGGRLVGIRRLREAGDGTLFLDLTREEFERLPESEHDHLGAPGDHWTAPLGYTLENFVAITSALLGQSAYVPPVHVDPELEDVHEITHGSPVWSGRRRVGHVDEVITDGGAVTELVVRREGVFGKHVRLPIARVLEVVGNNLHVDLSEGEEEALPEFRHEAP